MTDLYLPPPPSVPPPAATPPEAEDRPRRRLDRRALVVVLAVGVALDLAVRTGVASLAGAGFVLVVAVGVGWAVRADNRTAWVLGAGALAVIAWLPLRTSPWLVPTNVVVALGLLALAVTYAHGGRLRDLAFLDGARRVLAPLGHLLEAPVVLIRTATAGWGRRGALADGWGPDIARGVVLAVPVVAALALLLASADAVFASFFRLPLDPSSAVGHLFLVAAGVLGATALLLTAAAPRAEREATTRLRPVETSVLLTGVVLLYAAFAAAQVVAALGGADHVLETAGLSYAEYARTGFFQLLAVAGITLVLLLTVRGSVRPAGQAARRPLLLLAEATVALTLVIVAVAIRRLALYDEVFGLTMLRLSSTVAAWWIGGVFLLVGLAIAGVGRRHDWLAAAVLGLAVLTVIGYNAADPEAAVVRHNVARTTAAVPFDADYLIGLSDDAVPALEAALDDLDPDVAEQTIAAICADPGDGEGRGVLAWNRSVQRAAAVRDRLGC